MPTWRRWAVIVTNEGILERFARKHNQARNPLKTWLKISRRANWQHLMDVRISCPATDGNIKGAGYTVFNIKGNSFRLITIIDYVDQTVFVIDVFTHSEYDKWNRV